MIRNYKGYKIVNHRGLKELLKSEVIENDYQFVKFLQDNKVIIVLPPTNKEEVQISRTSFEKLSKKNEENRDKKGIKKYKIVFIYRADIIIEQMDNEISTYVERIFFKDLMTELYNEEVYITNIEVLRKIKDLRK